jgi:hypothetical protein
MRLPRLLVFNILAVSVVAGPLLALELLRPHYEWLEEHHGVLSFVLWFVALFVLYIYVLPRLGLRPNPRIFQ